MKESLNILNNLKKILMKLRFLFICPCIHWNDFKFIEDVERWKDICNLQKYNMQTVVAILLWEKPEFRNLLIYRNSSHILSRYWIALIYPPLSTLYIETTDIGGGLFIQHGFSTMISAQKIGSNCWINQQVTIGYANASNPPIIGDNVTITCGAKVLGEIVVGDNAVIGANAVVVKDVEAGAVMGGIPARKIK